MSCIRRGIFLKGIFGSHDYRVTEPVLVRAPAGYPAYKAVRYCTRCDDVEDVWLGRPPEEVELESVPRPDVCGCDNPSCSGVVGEFS